MFIYPEVLQAKIDIIKHSIPDDVYQSWRSKFHSCRNRKIPFHFTVVEWYQWWVNELAKIGSDAKRGLKSDHYMMCRYNDIGSYMIGNVYAGTPKQNAADTSLHYDRSTHRSQWHATHECHLKGKVGDDHPKSRAVITPNGRYGSIALASQAHGVTRQGGFYRVKRGEWSYE